MCVCSLRYPACEAHAPHYIVICGLSGSYGIFPTLSRKLHEFRQEVTKHKQRVLIFSTILPETFLILIGTQRDVIINVHRSSRKVPAITVRLQSNFNILDRHSKILQISNFMKIRLVGAELLHGDGRTDNQTRRR